MVQTKFETNALHLFRALLRATTYLPDDFARAYMYGYINRRFREVSRVTHNRLETARRGLNVLQRANNGTIAPLRKVLALAYGRTGRRRRELVSILQQLRVDPLPEVVPDLLKTEFGVDVPDEHQRAYYQLLQSLIKSQVHHADAGETRGRIRLEPNIPKENIWGRPLASCRRRNIIHKFWASTFEKLLPPLHEAEWNRLRDLATGLIPFEGVPPRRLRPPSAPKAFLSARELKQPIQDSAEDLLGPRLHVVDQHHITPRFMRRLWGDIWSQSPKASYDKKSSQWIIIWGGGVSAGSKGLVGIPGRRDLELFEEIHTTRAKNS